MKKIISWMLSFVIVLGNMGILEVYANSNTFSFFDESSLGITFPNYMGKTKISYGEFDGFIRGTKTMNEDGTEEQFLIEMPKAGEPLFKFENFSADKMQGKALADGTILGGTTYIWYCEEDITNFDFYVATDRINVNQDGIFYMSSSMETDKPFVYEFIFEYDGMEHWVNFLLVPSNMINQYKLVDEKEQKSNEERSSEKEQSNSTINETKIKFKEIDLKLTMPVIVKSGRSYFGMREIAEAIGAKVDWNGKTNTATATLKDKTVSFVIGSNKYTVNGVEKVMDATSFLENGRTYLPIRYICEGLGFTVDWDATTKTIIIK